MSTRSTLQRARRHHRDFRRGPPHAGRAARPQHAPRPAERRLHRLHRHAAVQAGRDHQAHLRRLRLALRLQALGRGRRDRQARLREPGREARRRAPRPEHRIAEKIEEAELDPDQAALLDKLLGKDYEVITADERLDKIAADFVEHCATRGRPARRCSSASTRSPAPACTSASCRAGRRRPPQVRATWRRSARKRRHRGRSRRARTCWKRREARAAGGLAGRNDHRDHHQRGAERGRRFQEVGLRHHPASRADEAGVRDGRRQSASMSRPPSRTRSIRSASRLSARCG